jgi:hypothetical protein
MEWNERARTAATVPLNFYTTNIPIT